MSTNEEKVAIRQNSTHIHNKNFHKNIRNFYILTYFKSTIKTSEANIIFDEKLHTFSLR